MTIDVMGMVRSSVPYIVLAARLNVGSKTHCSPLTTPPHYCGCVFPFQMITPRSCRTHDFCFDVVPNYKAMLGQ
jgi:hypothetical protein